MKDRKDETTHPEQRISRLPCKVSLVFDLVKQCKTNSFNLFKLKRKQTRKENIERGNFFLTKILFLDVNANCNFVFVIMLSLTFNK